MKKIALAAAFAAALAAPAAAQAVKVGIAAEPYPPFASPDASGNWVGWEVELIGAVCAAAEIQCEITPVAWDGIIPALTSGQIDAIMASMSITEERMKTIDFSDKYYNTPTVIATAKGRASRRRPKGWRARSSACRWRPFTKPM
jgi:polar amino acid transport system substrate-binding protein